MMTPEGCAALEAWREAVRAVSAPPVGSGMT